jgi:glycosyltransferase involved in cell wall biosynthesis
VKILSINKFYFQKRGAERYMFALEDLLEKNGHQVVPFAMKDPHNVRADSDRFFVSRVELERPHIGWNALKAAGRLFYSFEAKHKLAELIRAYKPDLAHLHNIYHQLSPSVLVALKEAKIPVVQTLHDYAYLSPSYGLFDHGAPCERVKPRRYSAAVLHRCVKNSFLASALDAAAYRYHAIAGLDERLTDRLIAPSEFVKKKFAEWGRGGGKISVIPHFVDARFYEANLEPGAEIVYMGGLSEEKGIGTLVTAMERVPEVRLKVVGSGPMEKRLKEYIKTAGLKNVELAGAMSHHDALAAMAASRFVVVPSLSYETFGLTAIEAAALGKAVIASDIGALPENVINNETGLLVPPGDALALADAIRGLAKNEPQIRRMGYLGRERALKLYDPADHYQKIMEIYRSVL